MKKPRQSRATKAIEPKPAAGAVPHSWRLAWPSAWQWMVAAVGLLVVFEVYGPAISGPFVFDDRYLPFFNAGYGTAPLLTWLAGVRPMLMFSFWIDHIFSGMDPAAYHIGNVIFHFLNSVLVAAICARFLEWAEVSGRPRAALAVFGGALFLLHPLQTEAVAYVASRSENLSVLFFLGAFCIFLYTRTDGITWMRAIAALVLFGAAVSTKEDKLTLPVLILLTDWWWNRSGWRKNWRIYALFAVAGTLGAIYVARILSGANTAGFGMKNLSPVTYFFTECRVVWIYLRMFVLPFGQNVDPDIAFSHGILDHGALFALLGLLALSAAAWFGRKRFPLAAFGFFAFLLLIAPTSSFLPIKDPMAEHRVYLPFLGLALIALGLLRRLKFKQLVWAEAAICVICAVLCFERNQVWSSSLALWQDTITKSPNKYRPRFQYAFALFEADRSGEAARNYEIASHLGPVDDELLIDWALALDRAGRDNEALEKLHQAAQTQPDAHVYATIGMIYAKQGQTSPALVALAQAERLDPNFETTYVYRGKIYQMAGNAPAAAREFQRALAIDPQNEQARDALAQVSR